MRADFTHRAAPVAIAIRTVLHDARNVECDLGDRRTGGRVRSDGFTLLEMVIVLALAALAVTSLHAILTHRPASIELGATALRMTSQMRLARERAIRRNGDSVVTIDVAARVFWSDADPRPRAMPRDVSIEMVTAAAERLNAGVGRIRWHGDGSSSGATVRLRRDGSLATITVDWVTGYPSFVRR